MTFDKPNRAALVEVATGVVGGVAVRWSIGELLTTVAALVLVNFLGCAILAAIVDQTESASTRRLVGIGFCGGLTTMSGAAVAVAQRFDTGNWSGGGGLGLLVLLAAASGFGIGASLRRTGLEVEPK
ncbi:MAG: CrcB family protein [Actinobacteria bacterium]|nr:CrcB family protein [Actinomycetota bacterium]